jgi:hypothetical protein
LDDAVGQEQRQRHAMVGRSLKAFGIVIGGFIVGGALSAAGHWVIGMIVGLAALPVGLTYWIVAED